MAHVGVTCRSVEIGLRVIGVWPGSPYSFLHRVYWASSLLAAQAFQYRYALNHLARDDLARLMDGLSTTMCYSLLLFKLSIFWLNRRVFHDILTRMAADWKDCSEGSSMDVMTNTADLSHRSSNLIIGIYSVCVVFYAATEILGRTGELFLRMELPFESESSPNYEIVMITQFFHQLSAATVAGVLNALIVTLILHMSGQIDIVSQILSEVSSKGIEHGSCIPVVRDAIVRHQRIISLAKDVERLLSYVALMQFLWNTLVICALGYVVVISVGSGDSSATLMKSLSFYVTITLEAFIYCYAGEYLSAKSKLIGTAAYNSPWYDLTPAQCKVLTVLMIRSQKALTITIGKFTDLSLERFTAIVQASASYVSVLLAMS